jgi:hypothetical protein
MLLAKWRLDITVISSYFFYQYDECDEQRQLLAYLCRCRKKRKHNALLSVLAFGAGASTFGFKSKMCSELAFIARGAAVSGQTHIIKVKYQK